MIVLLETVSLKLENKETTFVSSAIAKTDSVESVIVIDASVAEASAAVSCAAIS